MKKPEKIAIFASGGGTNAQAIMDSCKSGILKDIAQVEIVISNNADPGVFDRAREAGIDYDYVNEKRFPVEVDVMILEILAEYEIDIVILAGYMKKIGPSIVQKYEGRILNIHPAPLPEFGGEGMYGLAVHEAVLAAGEEETGPVVHFVNEHYDEGEILTSKRIKISSSVTKAEDLQKLVLPLEHQLYPEAILLLIQRIKVSE
jgi:phosphoribosylglycinamide formyltransferase-1